MITTNKQHEVIELLKLNRVAVNKMPGSTGISKNIFGKLKKLIELMDDYALIHDLIEDDRYVYISFDAGEIHAILLLLSNDGYLSEKNIVALNDIYYRYAEELV